MTAGNILERLMSFALPFLFSSFMQAFYGMVDMWTVGRFNTTASLAAVNTSAQVTQIVTGFCVGISMGTTVLIGHCVGAKNKKEYGIVITFAFGVMRCILSQLIGESMTAFFSTDKVVIYSAGQYMFQKSMLPIGLASPIGSIVSLIIYGYYLIQISKKDSHTESPSSPACRRSLHKRES